MPCVHCLQGEHHLAQQQQLIDVALQAAFPVQLGGAAGAACGWSTALAAVVDGDTARLRSELGHQLADAAAARGLGGVGVVAYYPVSHEGRHGSC